VYSVDVHTVERPLEVHMDVDSYNLNFAANNDIVVGKQCDDALNG